MNGIGWLLLETLGDLLKNNRKPKMINQQLKVRRESQKASLKHIKRFSSSAGKEPRNLRTWTRT